MSHAIQSVRLFVVDGSERAELLNMFEFVPSKSVSVNITYKSQLLSNNVFLLSGSSLTNQQSCLGEEEMLRIYLMGHVRSGCSTTEWNFLIGRWAPNML